MKLYKRLHASLMLILLAACAPPAHSPAGGTEHASVERGVRQLAEQIPLDLAARGAAGWTGHFLRGPGFFMASDGKLVFASNTDADTSMVKIARVLRKVELRWLDLRIDSLSPDLAMVATPFTEALTDSAGHTQQIAGYFTAVAERGDSGWQLRNLHWSLEHPDHAP